jgi:hypothetical protein
LISRPKSTSNLAISLARQCKYADAQVLHRQLITIEARLLCIDHHLSKHARWRLEDVMQRQREHCASIETHDKACRVVNPNGEQCNMQLRNSGCIF